MSTNIENAICSAIDIIVDRKIAQASFDKTILCTIVEKTDAATGRYKVRYQDSLFYVNATNLEANYSKGSSVYVLIPNGDMNKDNKTILNSVQKLGTDYISIVEKDSQFQVNGTNTITGGIAESGLVSYHGANESEAREVLYSSEASNNLLQLNVSAVEEYLRNSNYLICGAKIRTNLEPAQRYQGNYGIKFALRFLDNSTQESIIREYIVDTSSMTGNPYVLTSATRQYGIFPIDSQNFVEVVSIEIFATGFALSKPVLSGIDQDAADIFFTDIELSGADKIEASDDNYSLAFVTPQGALFYLDGPDKITIEANVFVKGQKVGSNVNYYWFLEDVTATENTPYGGQGWRCLNEYNVLSNGEDTAKEWISADAQYVVDKASMKARKLTYKCVAVYEGISIAKEIVIKNLTIDYDFEIISDLGTQFYYDSGYPTLTCKERGNADLSSLGLVYSWAVVNNNGTFSSMPETTELNNEFVIAEKNYNDLLTKIENEEVYYVNNKELLEEYKNSLLSYDKITRVEGNAVYKLNVNTIENFSTYYCAVYDQVGNYLGTSSIVLMNNLSAGGFSLVIENGTQAYQYNEAGISPASSMLDRPIAIPQLSFRLYDDQGNQVSDEDIRANAEVRWIVPTEGTLLTFESEDYIGLTLEYGIAKTYDYSKRNNNIQLEVRYKEQILSAETNFVFTKVGENGNSGNDLVCRLVVNTVAEDSTVYYPTVHLNSTTGEYRTNFIPKETGKFLQVQIWDGQELVFSGTQSGTSASGKSVSISWKMLQNRYNASSRDKSNFEVDSSTGIFTLVNQEPLNLANIAQAIIRYDGVTYYASMPLTLVYQEAAYWNLYNIEVQEKSGFREVMFSSDGKSPQYDKTLPFELYIGKQVSGGEEDITYNTRADVVDYYWITAGSSYETADRYLTVKDFERAKCWIKVAETYDGLSVNNQVVSVLGVGNVVIGEVYIPIYLYLNRYGNSALNDWDGNSIDINADGGFILAPQMGAGQKENDNSFTGVLMGAVKESGSTEDIGLFGYSKGQRSIFLDAKTGKAEFGTAGSGQVVIDPSSNEAIIRSGNYSSTSQTGSMLNLTTGDFSFGGGKLAFDSDANKMTLKDIELDWTSVNDLTIGNVSGLENELSNLGTDISKAQNTADNATSLANTAQSTANNATSLANAAQGTADNATTLANNARSVADNAKTIGDNLVNVLGYDGTKITGTYIYSPVISGGSILVGNTSGTYAQITADGVLNANGANITGTITAGNGKIGDWLISSGRLQNGSGSVYLSPTELKVGDKFKVTSDGTLTATNGSFTGAITATTGSIGGWTTDGDSIYTGTKTASTSQRISSADFTRTINGTSRSGLRLAIGENFGVSGTGVLYTKNADISGKITTDNITATAGTIGDWTLKGGNLQNSSGSVYINPTGMKFGDNFSVSSTGTVSASGGTFQGTVESTSGSIGGWSIDSGGLSAGGITISSSGEIRSGGWVIGDGGNTDFDSIYVDYLSAQDVFFLNSSYSDPLGGTLVAQVENIADAIAEDWAYTAVADLSADVSDIVERIYAELEKKVALETYNTKMAEIDTELAKKVNISDWENDREETATQITSLEESISGFALETDLDAFKKEVNAEYMELKWWTTGSGGYILESKLKQEDVIAKVNGAELTDGISIPDATKFIIGGMSCYWESIITADGQYIAVLTAR